jgi:hypothetical protein
MNVSYHPGQGDESKLAVQALKVRGVVLDLVINDCARSEGK